MASRRVYLGHIDIGPHGKLDLQTQRGEADVDAIVGYLFMYGLVATQVVMQGSAPLKCARVLGAFLRLREAFCRNEQFEPNPVFAFVLSDECESYADYLIQRLDFLKAHGDGNPELMAYDESEADSTAIKLDAELSLIEVPKRKHSVAKLFRRSLLAKLNSGSITNLHDESATETLRKVNDQAAIQTFSLIQSLEIQDKLQLATVYDVVRDTYRTANAFGGEAIDADTYPQYRIENLSRFIECIGLEFIVRRQEALNSELLFQLRTSEPLAHLTSEYFMCQGQSQMNEFIAILSQYRLNGKVRTMLKQGPAACVAAVFEAMNQAQIGYRSLNKGLEHITKAFIGEAFDEVYANKIHRLFTSIEHLKKEFSRMTREF